MDDITGLERRLTAAMDRIGHAVAAYDTAPKGPSEEELAAKAALEAELAQLREALAAEQEASAQLRERIEAMKALKDEQQERIATLEAEAGALAKARADDRAELDAVMAALEPLVAEGASNG